MVERIIVRGLNADVSIAAAQNAAGEAADAATAATSASGSAVSAAASAAAARTAAEQAAADAEALVISDLGTTDGQTRALIEAPASQTAMALSATVAATQTGLGFVLNNPTETPLTGADVYPIGTIDGVGYGRKDNGTLWRTTDGNTWTQIASGVQAYGIHKLGDGQVLINGANTLLRSAGWPNSPTFSVVATSNGVSQFLPSDVDTFDNVVIAAEYAIPRTDARYVKVSTDYGQTFANVLDLNVLEPAHTDATHWHAVCVDPFHGGPNPRLWASQGDAPYNGVRYSDDLGATWTVYDAAWQPMPMCATPAGIVTLTDANDPDGVYLIPRDLSEKQLLLVMDAPAWADTLLGFGVAAHRDPATNVVYMTFRGDQQPSMTEGIPATMFATDGVRASLIYSTVATGTVGVPAALNFTGLPTLLANGTLLATFTDAEGDRQYVKGATGRGISAAPPPAQALDRSSVAFGPGAVADRQSVVIGSLAGRKLDTDFNVVAVGELAKAGDQGTAVGFSSDVGNFGVGVGNDCTAGSEGVVVGSGSTAGTNGVVVGRTSQGGSGSVAIGRMVNAAGPGSVGIVGHPFSSPLATNAVLIGALKATTDGAVAIGDFTTEATGGFAAVAIGSNAKATGGQSLAFTGSVAAHFQSVSLPGFNTTADYQLMVGGRDVESTKNGGAYVMRSPDGTRYKLTPPNGGGTATWVPA